jgi:DNA-binding NtrC family response regulator
MLRDAQNLCIPPHKGYGMNQYSKEGTYFGVIEGVEKFLIEKALEESRGNRIKAAEILGIHRNTLHAKIKKMQIDIERYKL